MDFANDWEEREKERRTKLEELQEELGFPKEVKSSDKGYPEVAEEPHLPWDVNEAGVPRKKK